MTLPSSELLRGRRRGDPGQGELTEFANILALDMPSGYSSLGGQVRNPYAPTLMDDRGIPVSLPIEAAHKPAATATADPELEPPGDTTGMPRSSISVGA